MGLDGIPNRIGHFLQDLAPNPTNSNTHSIGLYLSKSQAFTIGLDARPQVHSIHGTGIGDCMAKAEAFIAANFPGCVL